MRFVMDLAMLIFVVLVAAGICEAMTPAEEFVFQFGFNNYKDTKDTHIAEYPGFSVNNMGDNIELECCEYDPKRADSRSILIRFGLSSVPRWSTIENATLGLYMTKTRNGESKKTVAAFRLLRDWAEGFGRGIDGRPAGPDEACGKWTGEDGFIWDAICADRPGKDFLPDMADAIEIEGEANKWYSWDISSIVQNWINNPQENFGLILLEYKPHSKMPGTKVFAAKEYPIPSMRPKLTIKVSTVAVALVGAASCWGSVKTKQ